MVQRGRGLNLKKITSRANPTYKDLRSLRVGFGTDRIVVEGDKLIKEALKAGLSPTEAWSTEASPHSLNCTAYLVSEEMYKTIAPTKTGKAPLALFPTPPLRTISEQQLKGGRYLLLDHVQEPGNGGALVRAAAAFGFDGVIWHKPCAFPFHHAAIRGSAGCVFHIPQYIMDEPLKSWPTPVLGAGMRNAIPLPEFEWPQNFVLVMGNEGHGFSPVMEAALTQSIHIPMRPQVESLNVAGAAHVLMYEANRK